MVSAAPIASDSPQQTLIIMHPIVLKVDDKEVTILTGLGGSMEAFKDGIRQVQSMGVSIVLATYLDGVIVFDGQQFYEACFGVKYTAEGRTGRGGMRPHFYRPQRGETRITDMSPDGSITC